MSLHLLLTYVAIVAIRAIRIDTKLGPIEGTTNNDSVHRFLNIPYAEPPVGKLRFQRTVPLQTTTLSGDNGYYDATDWGNACVNPTMGIAMNNDTAPEFTEDCLYLNVFTNYNFDDSNNNKELLPVMLWIHGGGLFMGTAATNLYEPSGLVHDQNIVVVTINYRLGITGFLIDENGEGGANAFLDMIESLKFVQKHIESFGGDPNQVTVAGESGGALAVCGLVVSPLARGLFKRSIQMSGSCLQGLGGAWSTKKSLTMQSIRTVMNELNMTDFQDLYTHDMQELTDIAVMKTMKTGAVQPTIDGYVFPMSIEDLLAAGHINGESVMIGTLIRESFSSAPMNIGYSTTNESDLNAFYYKYFHPYEVSKIEKYYPFSEANSKKFYKYRPTVIETDAELLQTVQQTDCWVRCGSIKQTEIIASHPITKDTVPAYFYQFGFYEEPYDSTNHGSELAYMLGNGATSWVTSSHWNETHDEYAKIVMQFFGEYIKGNGPNKECGASASVQNGVYIEVLDQVYISDLDELDGNKERCKLFEELGQNALGNGAFCMGTFDLDDTGDLTMEDFGKIVDEYFEGMEEADGDAGAESEEGS